MSITQKVFTSRTNSLDSESFVGEAGHLFYEQITTATGVAPVLKYSDGVTPGGIPIAGGGGVGNGYTGSQGEQGPPNGYTGSQGADSTVPGYVGSRGSQGFTGSAGTNGTNGSQGFIGSAGTNGTNGSQGFTGSQGSLGYTGSTGIGYAGSQGDLGYTGSQGNLGYVGSQGELGYTGSAGQDSTVPGYVGSQGDLGYVGSQGLGTIVQSDTAPSPANTSTLWYDTVSGRSYIYFDSSWVDAAPLAVKEQVWELSSSTSRVTLTNNGVITFDSASSLQASSGNFEVKVLSTLSSINLIGELHVHAPNSPTAEPIFRVLNDGQVRFLVPTNDALAAAFMVIGSTSSEFVVPQNPGVMIHTTGNQNIPSRVYVDGVNAYAAFVGRRYNGSSTTPYALTTGTSDANIMTRFGATPYIDTGVNYGWPSRTTARIDMTIIEDQTPNNQGNQIEFWTTPEHSNSIYRDIIINHHGITFRDGSIQDSAGILYTEKGFPGGVATLGLDGKVPSSQLPAGALVYQGAWDASSNTPALSDTTPLGVQPGWEYSVSVGGTRDIGAGTETFALGDFVIYNGTHWERIPGAAGGVTAFNGRTGSVNMTTTDVISVLTPASIAIDRLANSTITVTPGTGISGGGTVALGGSVTINNAGVTNISANTGITVNASTGSVTVSGLAATSSTFGVIKIGAGLHIDGNGVVTPSGVVPSVRNAGAVASLTVDFGTDDVILCSTTGPMSISLQNYVPGKIVRVMILQPAKRDITHGLQATNTNIGNTVLSSTVQSNTPNTVFIVYTCIAASQAGTYCQITF